MVNLSRCFTSCAPLPLPLLLLLLTLSWRTSTGHPVRAPALSAEACATCSSLFRTLLTNITELLKSDAICFGIPSDAVVMHRKAETLQACAPSQTQNSGCMMQRELPFSESECLKSIMKDLDHYSAAITSYLEHPLRSQDMETKLLSPTLEIIRSIMMHCSLDGENGSSEGEAAQPWGKVLTSTFDNRQKMCKMMKGFYIRTITINRAMGYISSGDHRK